VEFKGNNENPSGDFGGVRMREFSPEEFRKRFPHLAKELGGAGTVRISGVRTDTDEAEEEAKKDSYCPTIIDFIRRCETDDEALEIIEFMRQRKEITANYAERLKKQLKEMGLRSFGEKKELGYYFRFLGSR